MIIEIPLEKYEQLLSRIEAIEKIFQPESKKSIDYETIILMAISNVSNYHVSRVVSKSRKKELVTIRHAAINVLVKNTKMSLEKIGEIFSGRDHSTVIHAKKRHEDSFFTKEQEYIEIFHTLESEFNRIKFIDPIHQAIINPS